MYATVVALSNLRSTDILVLFVLTVSVAASGSRQIMCILPSVCDHGPQVT